MAKLITSQPTGITHSIELTDTEVKAIAQFFCGFAGDRAFSIMEADLWRFFRTIKERTLANESM